ncbi:Gfo/Idh/MocA family protein [Corynebacterium uterequi]|uniref:Putative dehydrogenase n=1 Tax=Corynebacterium uterequi TaxID=1072256 RepID=A0A0G3H9X1_9CORY|nr:Gfo/Idh/MocA family oxidoreductase [Corynebacterium uterequi]AKK10141.1 putative dehydrogenase [Corynebacterium uterequi]
MTTAALIGCGDVSTVHFEALREIDDIELIGVYDRDPDAAIRAARTYGGRVYNSSDAVLAAQPDVLHITTPHDQHTHLVLKAIEAGVHVLQEKPLAHSIAEGQKIVDAAADASVKVGVCFQNRYNVSSQQLRRLLDDGSLGNIYGSYSSVVWTRNDGYYSDKPWRGQKERSGGGLLMNQAIHTLDLVQWFLGEVVDVSGKVSTDKYGEIIDVEDTAHAYLTHDTGLHTSFYGTLTAPRHRPVELELDCENAYVILRDGLEVQWNDGTVDRYEERRAPSGGRSYWGVSHELLIRDFYSKLDDDEPFWISPEEALKSLSIAQAIYASSNSN